MLSLLLSWAAQLKIETLAAWIANIFARAIVSKETQTYLQGKAQKEAFATAVASGLAKTTEEYPHLARFFLSPRTLPIIDGELRRFLTRDEMPTADRLLAAYEKSLGRPTHP